MPMTLKRLTTISTFLILPLLLASLGSSFSSLTRVYVGSGQFVLSIFLGALVTSTFYAQNIESRVLRHTLIFIFGVVVPILYVQSANEVYGSGVQEYSEIWSPIYGFTTLIGLIEITLYIGIFFILIIRMIRSLFRATTSLVFKKKNDDLESDVLEVNEVKWIWVEGDVNTNEEHMELRYGRLEDGGYDDWMPVAFISSPKNNIFNVKFLIEASDDEQRKALEVAKRELDFYLVNKGEPDPWCYAKYHTTTMADVYSSIHWSFFSPKNIRNWKAYDPSWLVKASQPYIDEYPWLPAALEKCTQVCDDDPTYIYFVESKNANQPSSVWQFQENITLEDTSEGEIILDIIKPYTVGGLEFYDKLD